MTFANVDQLLIDALDMVVRAEALLNISAPPPPIVRTTVRSITDIRNAYEHIEDRALGQVQRVPHPDALSIFDFSAHAKTRMALVWCEH